MILEEHSICSTLRCAVVHLSDY